MRKEVNLIEIVDKDNNVIDLAAEKQKRLAPATGGGGDGENWLQALELGSVFTARQKVPKGQIRPWLCNLYLLKEKAELSSCIRCKMPDGKDVTFWVHTLDFSRQNDYVETIAVLQYDEGAVETEEEVEHE
jgi:hypothetical protein